MGKELTGYPSVDKPWLKYYSEEAISAPLPKMSMYEYLRENNKDHLDDIALIFYHREITYRALFENIDRAAQSFSKLGVKENDVVTLMVLNQPEVVYCLYALNKIGAVTCVINVLSSSEEIERYLSEGNSKYFVALDLFFEKAYQGAKQASVKKLIYLPLCQSADMLHKIGYRFKVKKPKARDNIVLSWSQFLDLGKNGELLTRCRGNETDSVIGHTGGTTGFPKGVMLSDDAFNAIASQYGYAFQHERQETLLNLIVPFAIYGLVVNLHMPLSLGMKVVLIPKVDPQTVDELIVKYRPNYVISIPTYWNGIIDSTKIQDLSFLKIAAAGGSEVPKEHIAKLNEVLIRYHAKTEFLMGYGMSEVGATACTQMNGCAVLGSVGIPLVKNLIAAFDTGTMEEMPYYEVGEICINGPATMLGYIRNETETAATLKVHKDGKVWVHTGDLGYMDENGNVFINGRLKRIYLTEYHGAASKIFPDRIESTLMKHSGLSECCVVCISPERGIYRPVAFVSPNGVETTESIEQELRANCEKELPEYDWPIRYVFRKTLPHTAHGKIDYRALEQLAEEEKQT